MRPACRHSTCWQLQRNSVMLPARRHSSLQYLPLGPFGSTTHSHASCAHFAFELGMEVPPMATLRLASLTRKPPALAQPQR
jgi:hypothetical protein